MEMMPTAPPLVAASLFWNEQPWNIAVGVGRLYPEKHTAPPVPFEKLLIKFVLINLRFSAFSTISAPPLRPA